VPGRSAWSCARTWFRGVGSQVEVKSGKADDIGVGLGLLALCSFGAASQEAELE
jgi:hypothetical protein